MRNTLIAAALCSGFLFGCSGLSTASSDTTTESSPAPDLDTPPAGYTATGTPGIYQRWCTDTCSSSAVIGDNSYSLLEVWCKEQACGDIYGRVNLLDSAGTVVGWTNDTAYGDLGQKVVLTFDSHQEADKVQLTELNFRS